MRKQELLGFFISIFPDFKKIWESESNFFCEERNYTSHGVCAEFSHYFIDNFDKFSDEDLKILFREIEMILMSDTKKQNEMTNAVCTCFLENIAQTEAGKMAKKYFGKKSKEYFNQWN